MAPSLLLVGDLLATGEQQSLVLDRRGSCLGIEPLGLAKMGGSTCARTFSPVGVTGGRCFARPPAFPGGLLAKYGASL